MLRIGGRLGYGLLRTLGKRAARGERAEGTAYQAISKLEILLGPAVWNTLVDKTVIDFGCGGGAEAVELARHGARRVIGIDNRQKSLELARKRAAEAGVGHLCEFATDTREKADVILSIDAFEHYDEPEAVLELMRSQLADDGQVLIAFGPPWLHPLGGHLFSVFPWAHLLFSEEALMRWRADFKHDGARRFGEVEGGLNQMTVRRFMELIEASHFALERFEAVPIRRLRWLHNPLTQELLTSVVRCTLRPARQAAATSSRGAERQTSPPPC